MVFASAKYKASISAPAISVTVLASVKSVTLLGLTNQSEGLVMSGSPIPSIDTFFSGLRHTLEEVVEVALTGRAEEA